MTKTKITKVKKKQKKETETKPVAAEPASKEVQAVLDALKVYAEKHNNDVQVLVTQTYLKLCYQYLQFY